MIIDPPSPFATLDEWRNFRAELDTLEPENPDDMKQIAEAIAEADAHLQQAGLD